MLIELNLEEINLKLNDRLSKRDLEIAFWNWFYLDVGYDEFYEYLKDNVE